MAHLFPFNPDSTRFVVTCRRSDYSAGRIARAIEDCNAHILNLNVTDQALDDDLIAVDIRVDRQDTASIARSLARYDYTVVGSTDDYSAVSDTERERVTELLRILDL